jgi:hypothetical protein
MDIYDNRMDLFDREVDNRKIVKRQLLQSLGYQ